jgi:hypothetical protein
MAEVVAIPACVVFERALRIAAVIYRMAKGEAKAPRTAVRTYETHAFEITAWSPQHHSVDDGPSVFVSAPAADVVIEAFDF